MTIELERKLQEHLRRLRYASSIERANCAYELLNVEYETLVKALEFKISAMNREDQIT